ncbi:iron-enterobactin ABC transporter permease [Serratia odorifera]|uniref:Iron chelate uptake ABC transporter, FeCT family, permease protein n=2 Tax=Serratia odorifera TaxID=618 RepID=D4E3C8_SEROD|nr:iron-enterobactin ABC transporter permease [Serratia odorifera]EFE95704.1 iron chelate uptake ABC transporter, FeCT family, permease protein [Serratia odorifera DSM 4582]PNK90350.1 iron ABC transporter permease [Serratia odorifera]RII71414.1 iron-enterobactin ABC transporter permease [Serratia odorifera]VDZ59940.1 Ferric enterobactin transport system permease protein fepG [Serratia odorifera]
MSLHATRLMRPSHPARLSRATLTLLALLFACASLAIYALGSGTLSLSALQVIDALRGEGPANLTVIVSQWRLPRVAMALILGAALGISGAIFQSLLRNPLGSPDVIGFNTGAYSGVLVAVVLFNGGVLGITSGALIGGLLTAALIYLLAWRNGIEAFRLIIVGIAVRALLVGANTWLIITASLESAMTAGLWSAGSLNGVTWAKSQPVMLVIAVCALLLMALSRRMRLLEMGDDAACALGVAVERSRILLLLIAVLLTAAATAVAGPISFIALVAPQIARRLCANRQVLLLTALTGALLLLAADVTAQRLFMPYQLPVGALTVSIGGIYLIWLLIRESRKK